MKPRILDLFCGAGGCTKGYQEAGFEVTGVDRFQQPHYCGDEFWQDDALSFLERSLEYQREQGELKWDAIHASPPCQAHSPLRKANGREYSSLIAATRELLESTGLPYVIENVPGAPLDPTVTLCGSMFGLGAGARQLRRHRLFETNFPIEAPSCAHASEAIGVYGGGPTTRSGTTRGGYQGTVAEKAEALGIDWMTGAELNQAIPPSYTKFIGERLSDHLKANHSDLHREVGAR
jgi:DNA (cytosine-5)-methyltransferase 1